MTSTVHSGTSTKLGRLVSALGAILGVSFDFSKAKEFKITLHSPDGDNLMVTSDGQSVARTNIHQLVKHQDLNNLPANGAPNASISSGTATLVASTKTITVDPPETGVTPVPVGSTVYATVDTPGGVTRVLSAARASDTTITVSSPGSAYKAVTLADNGATGVLVAGTKDITLDNAVGDLLSVRESVAGGTAAAGFSVKRKNATEVTVFAHKADGSVETTNTSTVQVFNHGAAATETSLVRWAVVRP